VTEEGHIPDDWRSAFISAAIFKKGARKFAENYRPISLTSIVCKLMESLIKEHVVAHFIENNLSEAIWFYFRSVNCPISLTSIVSRGKPKRDTAIQDGNSTFNSDTAKQTHEDTLI
jgi:hypothetical protein